MEMPERSAEYLNRVIVLMRVIVEPRMITRLTEYKPVIVRIPERRLLIPSFVFNRAVINPANAPANMLANMTRIGLTPSRSKTPVIAAPDAKTPSALKSGNLRIRKVIHTPRPTQAKNRPSSKDTVKTEAS